MENQIGIGNPRINIDCVIGFQSVGINVFTNITLEEDIAAKRLLESLAEVQKKSYSSSKLRLPQEIFGRLSYEAPDIGVFAVPCP